MLIKVASFRGLSKEFLWLARQFFASSRRLQFLRTTRLQTADLPAGQQRAESLPRSLLTNWPRPSSSANNGSSAAFPPHFTFVKCANIPSGGPLSDPSLAIVNTSVSPSHTRFTCLPFCVYVHVDAMGPKLTIAVPLDWNSIFTEPSGPAYVCPFTLFPQPARPRQTRATAAAAHPLRLLTFIPRPRFQVLAVTNSANPATALTRCPGATGKLRALRATVPHTNRHRFQCREIGSPSTCFVSLSPLSIVLWGEYCLTTLTTRNPRRQAFSLSAEVCVESVRECNYSLPTNRLATKFSFGRGAQ